MKDFFQQGLYVLLGLTSFFVFLFIITNPNHVKINKELINAIHEEEAWIVKGINIATNPELCRKNYYVFSIFKLKANAWWIPDELEPSIYLIGICNEVKLLDYKGVYDDFRFKEFSDCRDLKF